MYRGTGYDTWGGALVSDLYQKYGCLAGKGLDHLT